MEKRLSKWHKYIEDGDSTKIGDDDTKDGEDSKTRADTVPTAAVGTDAKSQPDTVPRAAGTDSETHVENVDTGAKKPSDIMAVDSTMTEGRECRHRCKETV